ncbi:MAG: WYL domain-containing protein [Erysipelotrichaceae bacterium]|nr:WYL domain-containing protein [Erysipelotrichaceae bacterium]
MEEKIKIYIPESVNSILLKDMELFEFFKKDGSLNKNEFYNTLIVNYYEQYEENQSAIFSHIIGSISEKSSLTETEAKDIAADILQYVDVRTYQLDRQKYDVAIAMKPTRKSSDDIEYIQNCLLGNSTLSNYFRNMFASYSLLPQDKRETIIFKQNFDLIREAIEEDRKVYFTTVKNTAPHIMSPYTIASSREELFNYLIGNYKDHPYSFRISRIRQVKILNESRDMPEGLVRIFEWMEKFGPQFSYDIKKPRTPIIVRLTENGRRQFRSMYLHRPSPFKIEEDLYYFDCSRSQAFQYFSRLGSNATVLKPEDLADDLYRFYSMAERKYRKLVREEPGNE